MSCGTNIIAEIMAYVHPLLYLAAQRKGFTAARVHIVTDCQYLTLAARERTYRKKNAELWAFIEACGRRGLQTHWHYIPRDTIDLNRLGHSVANAARLAAAAVSRAAVPTALSQLALTSIEGVNP